MYSEIPAAQTLVLQFKSKGIKNIVISPGSRNAPLTLSFTRDSYFQCFSIVDERAAGFFALGMAQQLQEPVAVVCTSGSALLNYYPAVAEAFYSDVPLFVVSADRPSYKIDIGDGQTIRQEGVFEKHIAYSANLKQDSIHGVETVTRMKAAGIYEPQTSIQSFNAQELHKALTIGMRSKAPIHINIPFEEPLYNTTDTLKVEIDATEEEVSRELTDKDWSMHSELWKSSKRKMVLIGVNTPNSVSKKVLEALANDDSVLVFTETTSNLHHPEFFPSIDSIVAPIERSSEKDDLFKALQPDLLVTFGGLIVSKKIKAFLREYQPKTHWHVDTKKAYDTFFCLSDHIKWNPDSFFTQILSGQRSTSGSLYKKNWTKVKGNYEHRREDYLQKIPFTDFKVFNQIMANIPKDYQVHLANSSTVRYTQLFNMDASLKVYCNRGTSGIDGSTSTAVGASVHHGEPTLLITGDLSFFYDNNGLWNSYLKKDFRILLINNSGGGIFRILPGFEATDNFSTFFETSHGQTAEHLCRMHGLDYLSANDEVGLTEGLQHFYSDSNRPKLLEIFTPRELNNKVLLDYFDFIS